MQANECRKTNGGKWIVAGKQMQANEWTKSQNQIRRILVVDPSPLNYCISSHESLLFPHHFHHCLHEGKRFVQRMNILNNLLKSKALRPYSFTRWRAAFINTCFVSKAISFFFLLFKTKNKQRLWRMLLIMTTKFGCLCSVHSSL